MEEQQTEPTQTPTPVQQPRPEQQKAMPQEEFRYAGFWIRFLAAIIDGIILTIIGLLVGAGTIEGFVVDVDFVGWRSLIPIVYFLVFWIALGATPGKLALGLKIIETDGKKLRWTKAILRFIGSIVSTFIIFLGFIWIGIDKKKQGWHDKIADTYVIRKPRKQ